MISLLEMLAEPAVLDPRNRELDELCVSVLRLQPLDKWDRLILIIERGSVSVASVWR